MIAIYFGAWNYSHPDFLGIPYWLPFVWGNASLYIIDWHTMIDGYLKKDNTAISS
jgi:hypothetical protein